MKQADIEKVKRLNIEILQAPADSLEQLAKLLGTICVAADEQAWIAFCHVPRGSGFQLYWCLASEHAHAQAALVAVAQRGFDGTEYGRFDIRCVRCKPGSLGQTFEAVHAAVRDKPT